MTFQTIDFPIAGPSYQSRSKPLSSQRTINWYPQLNQEGKESYTLMPFPGLKQIGDFNTSLADRGLTRMDEVLYQVKGNFLYSIDNSGNHTERGSVPGSERCVFANDGVNLVIVTNKRTFIYSSDTEQVKESITTGTTGALSVDIINFNFVFTFDQVSFIATLDNANKTFTTNGQVGAETKPDDLVRDYVFEQVVWRLGKRTTEGWYFSGVGTPPIERLEGQIFDVGCASRDSVSQTDEAFYWLGDDAAVYQARAGTKVRISTDAISNEISKQDDLSNVVGFTFTLEGQNFYALQLPNRPLFVYSESLGQKGWFECSSGLDEGEYQGSSFISAYNKIWVADKENGKVYNLDLDTYLNDGEAIKRTRVTTSVNGNVFRQKGERVQMSKMLISMETGLGLLEGQGENPRIMIEPSYDGGRTWDGESWPKIGRQGQHTLKVQWFSMKSFYDMMIRITITDPVSCAIYGSSIDLRRAGK